MVGFTAQWRFHPKPTAFRYRQEWNDMVACVLFDLDETLFNRTASLRAFLTDQYARHGPLNGLDCDDLIERFLVLDQRGTVAKSVVYPQLLRTVGIDHAPLAELLLDEYETKFHTHARGFPGLDKLPDALRQRGLRLGIVTNGRTVHQSQTIRALLIDRWAEKALISESEGIRKPDPAIFARAAAMLDAKPGDCVFIGDSPLADIKGAHDAGMRTIWFPNGAVWPANIAPVYDAKIHQLDEIPALISAFSRDQSTAIER